jgi:N-acetylglucosamine malate deacetylase 1
MIKNYFRQFRQIILRILVTVFGKKFHLTNGKTLIIAPHPDDETFGCAGLILKKVAGGTEVNVLFLTNGEQSLTTVPKEEVAKQRISDAKEVASILGVKETYFLELTDGKIPRRGSIKYNDSINKLANLIKELNPEEVYVTHPLDNWSDHTGASELAFDVLKDLENEIALYYYWVWVWYSLPFQKISNIRFRNTYFLSIKDVFTYKKQATEIYLESLAKNGKPYCGKLPKLFLSAFDWPYEVIEKKL